jgi:hypothetical protein
MSCAGRERNERLADRPRERICRSRGAKLVESAGCCWGGERDRMGVPGFRLLEALVFCMNRTS